MFPVSYWARLENGPSQHNCSAVERMASGPAAAAPVTREMMTTWHEQGKPGPDPRGPSPGLDHHYNFDAQQWEPLKPASNSMKPEKPVLPDKYREKPVRRELSCTAAEAPSWCREDPHRFPEIEGVKAGARVRLSCKVVPSKYIEFVVVEMRGVNLYFDRDPGTHVLGPGADPEDAANWDKQASCKQFAWIARSLMLGSDGVPLEELVSRDPTEANRFLKHALVVSFNH